MSWGSRWLRSQWMSTPACTGKLITSLRVNTLVAVLRNSRPRLAGAAELAQNQ